MCTIALAWQVLADAPLAIAANRDEALERASRPPALLDDEPAVLAPRDAVAGGTWIGVSERGLVAAITNRWTEPPDAGGAATSDEAAARGDEADADESESTDSDTDAPAGSDTRSRGLLVRDALGTDDATAALDLVREAVATDRYAGFNLLLADADRAVYLEWNGVEWDGAGAQTDADPSLRVRDLEPGVHAIVNPGLNEVDERAVRLREALAVEGTAPGAAAWLDAAATRLRDHEFDVCVHGVRASDASAGSSDERSESDGDGFGTRSSSLVRVGPDGRAAYAFADGPPCEASYEQVASPAAFVEESF